MSENTVPATETPAEQQAPELKLSNLQNLLQIVDVAATRGAFRGPELTIVGRERDALASFVAFMTPAATEGDAETPAETPAEEVAPVVEAPAKKKTAGRKKSA